jgi:hypothetical protein
VFQGCTEVSMEDGAFVFRVEKCVGGEICWIMCAGCKGCGQGKEERVLSPVWANRATTKTALLGP